MSTCARLGPQSSGVLAVARSSQRLGDKVRRAEGAARSRFLSWLKATTHKDSRSEIFRKLPIQLSRLFPRNRDGKDGAP
jgi:hypothetical protein